MTQAVLPGNEADPAARAGRLAATRDQYIISHERVPGLAVLAELPEGEALTPEYGQRRAEAEKDVDANFAACAKREPLDPFPTLEDYEAMFQVLTPPRVMKDWRSDRAFAEQALSGANPMSLRRVESLPDHCQIDDSHVVAALGAGSSVAALAGEGRLFIVDHSQTLAHIAPGEHPGGAKYCPKPIALFAVQDGAFVPVAIEIDGDDPSTGTIFTPASDPMLWLLAKTCFQVADGTVHELSSHLARTHLVMAPFAIATARQLADTHPVGLLLRPHFRFMLAINDHALVGLINPGGPVDQLFGGSLENVVAVAGQAAASWSVDAFALPNELKGRGVDDLGVLPHYAYRDDGLLLWQAIGDYVRAYLALYYADDAGVRADSELQAWAAELVAEDGCRVRGMSGSVESVASLADVLTTVIYTCAATHSAVNGSQYEYMAFAPNRPFAGYADYRSFCAKWKAADAAPPSDEALQFYMRFLPPHGITCMQLGMMSRLSFFQYDRLGQHDGFSDPAAKEAQQSFQAALEGVEETIDERNAQRQVPYLFLKPSKVLNGISI